MWQFRDVAQPGSVLAWGARGRWFESSHPDSQNKTHREMGFIKGVKDNLQAKNQIANIFCFTKAANSLK